MKMYDKQAVCIRIKQIIAEGWGKCKRRKTKIYLRKSFENEKEWDKRQKEKYSAFYTKTWYYFNVNNTK